jgi:uncharacterized membrane protein YfcA
MSFFEAVMLCLTGIVAGTMNSVIGSGGLVTFPTLLAFGYSPLVANMTNNMGSLPGALSGAIVMRKEMQTQWARILRLSILTFIGGLGGALLLLMIPAAAFNRIVPILIALALVLIIIQPRLQARAAKCEVRVGRRRDAQDRRKQIFGDISIFLTGIYGGYFGAAQGILLMSILGAMFDETIHKLNSVKIMLDVAAAIVFIVHGGVAWKAAAAISVGSILGGVLGAYIGRRLPTALYRGFIVLVGLAAIVKLLNS